MAKIVFLQNIWHEYLGVMQLSAVLKEHGHKCDVLLGDQAYLIRELKKSKPDLIAFSAMVIQEDWVLETAKAVKRAGIKAPVIVGGPHPTFYPDFIKEKPIDMICIGEGEYALLDLMNAIARKKDVTKIKNLWVKKKGKIYRNELRPLIQDLDELPLPDRTLYKKYDFFRKQESDDVMISRGCPFRCSFCFNHKWCQIYAKGGSTIRFRSVDDCIREIKQLEKRGSKMIMFIDSTFNIKKDWLMKFLKRYKKEIKTPFSCNIRADLLDDELAKALKDTGHCDSIRFAVEVGDEKLRNTVLRKGLTDAKIWNATRLLKKYKLPIITFNMFGLPDETIKQAWKTIYMNRKIKPDVLSCYVFLPFPGLEITEYAIKKGYVKREDLKKLGVSPYKMHRSIINQKDIDEVTNLHKFSIFLVKHPKSEFFIKYLIKLPPNILFDYFYNITQGLEWMRWMRASPLRMVVEIIKNYKEVS
jgi:radical SAM superfamily enzyme YgiQ (UPF0313 family)